MIWTVILIRFKDQLDGRILVAVLQGILVKRMKEAVVMIHIAWED